MLLKEVKSLTSLSVAKQMKYVASESVCWELLGKIVRNDVSREEFTDGEHLVFACEQ